MTPAQVLVEMTLNDLRREDSYGVFPVDCDLDIHVRPVIVDAGDVKEGCSGLLDHIAYLRTVDDDLAAGRNIVLYPPRLVESPFCGLASFLGNTRDDYSHIIGRIGADIGQGEHSCVINLECPIDDLVRRLSQVLAPADFERILCDLVRAFAQLVRFVALPERLRGDVVGSLRFLIAYYRRYCGPNGRDGGNTGKSKRSHHVNSHYSSFLRRFVMGLVSSSLSSLRRGKEPKRCQPSACKADVPMEVGL